MEISLDSQLFERLRQKDYKSKACLLYRVNSRLVWELDETVSKILNNFKKKKNTKDKKGIEDTAEGECLPRNHNDPSSVPTPLHKALSCGCLSLLEGPQCLVLCFFSSPSVCAHISQFLHSCCGSRQGGKQGREEAPMGRWVCPQIWSQVKTAWGLRDWGHLSIPAPPPHTPRIAELSCMY